MTYFKNKYIGLTFIATFFSLNLFSQFKSAILVQDKSSRGDISFLFTQIKFDTISFSNRSEYINKLKHLEINSGIIYFSGSRFQEVIQPTLKGRLSIISNLFDSCISGSKITFQNCTFKNDDGSISKLLNKSIFIK